tara:strand:- start:372 stop:695 length:324 start_codon:yes stop_codon:yes gene_type:complete
MMSLATLQYVNQEIAAKAAAEGRTPYVVWPGEVDAWPPFPFPNIGDYEPEGWELVESYFVDKTGRGYDWEPALSLKQFKQKIKPGFGYAVIEEGEFQVVIGQFKKLS